MKIIFIGSGNFSVPILKALSKEYHICLCITHPDKRVGRGKKIVRSDIGIVSDELGIMCYSPTTVNSTESIEIMEEMKADIAVLASFSEILNTDVINVLRFGIINVHPSLLPKYRGAEPIRWAIRRGETVTGVSIMELSKELDRGNVLYQEPISIQPQDDEGTLRHRLVNLSIDMLPKAITEYRKGYRGTPQRTDRTFYARRMKKSDEIIHWEWSAQKVDRHIRSMSPKPGCYTIHKGKRIKLFEPTIINTCYSFHQPGEIIESKKSFVVSCGIGMLSFDSIQREGKRKIPVGDFLMTGFVNQGDILGEVDFTD
jgi:methionyl-tRNA formyltransferase